MKRICWLGLLLALVCVQTAAAQEVGKKRRPNVVFILIDDLGWTDVGCFRSKFYQTPNIDRLATQGMKFTSAYTANPVCSPTRCSIMTGKNPARLHLTNYLIGRRWPADSPLREPDWLTELPDDEMTLAEIFKAAGYTTGIIGKWHLGMRSPLMHGFDFNLDGSMRGSPPGYFDKEGNYLTDRHAAAAEKFIDDNKDRPFFLYLPHYAVHTPLQAKKDIAARYQKKAEDNPPTQPVFFKDVVDKVRQVQNHAVYAAMVDSMDQSVGRVMKKLQELGLEENTIVVFFSDNGGLCSSEGHPTTNLPLRLGKGWLYEGGVRVPMIVRWPGHTRPGSTCPVPVISDDFCPTLVDMAGLPAHPKQHLDGKSLVPLLKGGKDWQRDTLYWHYPHYSNQGGRPSGAIRHDDFGEFKLIEFFDDGRVELYNLENDLGERNDLAQKMPDRAQQMLRMLHAWRQDIGAQVPARKE